VYKLLEIIRYAVPLGCKHDIRSSMPLYSKSIPHKSNMSIHTQMLNTVSIPLNTMSMPHNTAGVALSTVNMPLSIPLYGRNIPHIYLYCERTPGYYEYAYMNTMTFTSEHCENTTGYHQHTS